MGEDIAATTLTGKETIVALTNVEFQVVNEYLITHDKLPLTQ